MRPTSGVAGCQERGRFPSGIFLSQHSLSLAELHPQGNSPYTVAKTLQQVSAKRKRWAGLASGGGVGLGGREGGGFLQRRARVHTGQRGGGTQEVGHTSHVRFCKMM